MSDIHLYSCIAILNFKAHDIAIIEMLSSLKRTPSLRSPRNFFLLQRGWWPEDTIVNCKIDIRGELMNEDYDSSHDPSRANQRPSGSGTSDIPDLS
mmetsp:Transcript_10851/g.14337  ORF Transcript_10851/g.14337 Transcript_10851/m.14337 type:complete len:96 (-) Transcript_10851:248-535(-)